MNRRSDSRDRTMPIHRRSFIRAVGSLAATGSMARVIASTSPARARSDFAGYGELVKDPDGIVDLPPTFRYRIFSRAGEPLSSTGTVPSDHDGMAAFSGDWRGIYLVRNHELNPIEIAVQ